jgi:hypothetical protein
MLKGKKEGQIFFEGVSLRARPEISPDRRFVRIKLIEKSLEVEGVEKVTVPVDRKGDEATAEVASLKEETSSLVRYIPDGGTLLVPLQYRPRGCREKDRWLIAQITVQIYIEAEERQRRGLPPK